MIYISLRVFIGTGWSGRENSEELSGVSGAVCVAVLRAGLGLISKQFT